MDYFAYKPYEFVQVDKDGRKVLAVSINPRKSCIFNCSICNLEKTEFQGEWHDFGPVEDSLEGLREKIAQEKPDIVELYGKGDILTNTRLEDIISCIHAQGLPVRMLTNCYLLGIGAHMRAANLCEEVVAGFCFTREDDFQKIHRPRMDLNFSAAKQTESMVAFSRQYQGKFILRVLLVKGFNDSDEQVAELKSVVDQVAYDTLWVGTWPKLSVDADRVAEIDKFMRA